MFENSRGRKYTRFKSFLQGNRTTLLLAVGKTMGQSLGGVWQNLNL